VDDARSVNDRVGRAAPLLVILGLGLAFRVVLVTVVAPDAGFASDLQLFAQWATTIANAGPGSIYRTVSSVDYPPGYLWVLWLLGSLANGVASLTGADAGAILAGLLKVPAITADLALAGLLGWAGTRWFGARVGLIAAALWLFVPVSWYDSALWGQVDSVGTLVLVASLVLLVERRHAAALALAVVAALIKPQLAIGLGVVLPVLVRRELLVERRPGRLLGEVAIGFAVGVTLLLPFDLSTMAAPSLAFVPVIGDLAGLVGLFVRAGGEFSVLTANAFNVWALVGDPSLAASIGGGGASWTADSYLIAGIVPAVIVGAVLLAGVGVVVALGLLRRDGVVPIVLGASILALAFFAVPTRVHERYLVPFFGISALLAARSAMWAAGYLALGVANAIDLHAVLAGSLRIGRIDAGGAVGGALAGPRGGDAFGPPRGGFGGPGAQGIPGREAIGGVFRSLQLPFAELARSEGVVILVAVAHTAALVGLLVAWVVVVLRPERRTAAAAAPRSGAAALRPGWRAAPRAASAAEDGSGSGLA
jgi:dolichyl-phosphate-mannose-protein mannosyltransferase